MKNNETFTAAQIQTLVDAFKSIERIDPDSIHYRKMRDLISKLSDTQLKALAGQQIKFLTALCRNEIIVRRQAKQQAEAVPAAIEKLAELFGQGAPVTLAEKDVRTNKPTAEDLENFRNRLEDFMVKHHEANYNYRRTETMLLEVGRKYARIFRNGPGVNSCYCFISLENGQIFKPATWSAPAKHARGHIYMTEAELFGEGKVCGPYGVIYLR